MLANVNWLAVAGAALAHQLLGAVLWAPPLLGARRMRLTGRPAEALMEEGPRNLLLTTPAALLTASGIAVMISLTGMTEPGAAVILGALLWLFFVATGMWGDTLMDKRPLGVYALNQLVQLLSLVTMALIIAIWP